MMRTTYPTTWRLVIALAVIGIGTLTNSIAIIWIAVHL